MKLFVGMLFDDSNVMQKASSLLKDLYGEIDTNSPVWKFDFTKYYEKEMGKELYRAFISFKRLISPEELSDIKITTNALEETFYKKDSEKRSINLDPGYIALSKLVLASTKDYTHRLYIGKGIYAEITLRYQAKKWDSWEWTYPDYKSPHYLEYFENLRILYKNQIDIPGE